MIKKGCCRGSGKRKYWPWSCKVNRVMSRSKSLLRGDRKTTAKILQFCKTTIQRRSLAWAQRTRQESSYFARVAKVARSMTETSLMKTSKCKSRLQIGLG